jgi:putative ABC transport system substrate-binding protein
VNRRKFIAVAGGATVFWPFVADAQRRQYRIGYLALEPGEDFSVLAGPLRDLGYVEGRNVAVEQRSAGGDPARLAALAGELVLSKPDLLVAGWGTLAPKALKAATTTIPIVFSTVGDPVGVGLVQSLARPGGNATGPSGQSTEFKAKQLQLLMMCLPGQRVVGVFLNPDTPFTALALKELRAAADQAGIRLETLEARKPADFTSARMDALAAAGATSLFVIEDPLSNALRDMIIDQANRLRLPVMTGLNDFAPAGALMTYGIDRKDRYRRAAQYIDRILKGAAPADLPVDQPTKFYLVINLKAAKTLGVTVPQSLLATANEVIE